MRASTIDFEALRYLSVSAEAGTLSRAARILGIETGSLSRRLHRVEDELGLTLFERGHDGIRLTAGGTVVMVHVHRMMADLSALMATGQSAGLGTVGKLRLGVRLPSVGEPIQGLLKTWRSQNPDVDVSIYEMHERNIFSAIQDRRLDLAFMTKHTLWPRAVAIPICEIASNRDPSQYLRRLLIMRANPHLRWGHGWKQNSS